jgi:hypothetical protein
METWQVILGIAIMLGSFGLMVWKTAKYVRRGWKDHVWFWWDAHDAARQMAIITGFLVVANLVRHGVGLEFWITAGVAAVFIAAPYIAYITGRLLGMRHRARQRRRLS